MTVTPFIFTKATKTKRKARVALIGYEGTGKTFTALALAAALAAHDGKRVALADSEGNSATIYADRYDFDHISLTDASPQTYVQLLTSAIAAGYGALVYDSLSHEWIGAGGALEMKDRLSSGADSDSFRAWGKVTPEHRRVFDSMLRSPIHVIATMRQKKAYVVELNEKGRNTPRLIGTEPVQRDGAEYEFDLILTLDQQNTATVTKSRFVGIAQGTTFAKPGAELATLIIAALDEGAEDTAAAPTIALTNEELSAIVRLGQTATPEVKAMFYDVWLPEHGFTDDTATKRWKRFGREGGGVLALQAIEWWRDTTAPTTEESEESAVNKAATTTA